MRCHEAENSLSQIYPCAPLMVDVVKESPVGVDLYTNHQYAIENTVDDYSFFLNKLPCVSNNDPLKKSANSALQNVYRMLLNVYGV